MRQMFLDFPIPESPSDSQQSVGAESSDDSQTAAARNQSAYATQQRFLLPNVILLVENDGYAYLYRGLQPREYKLTWPQACLNHPHEARLLLDQMAVALDEPPTTGK